MSQLVADAVACAILAKYGELPKNGKPSPTEWTILAGLAATRPRPAASAATSLPGPSQNVYCKRMYVRTYMHMCAHA